MVYEIRPISGAPEYYAEKGDADAVAESYARNGVAFFRHEIALPQNAKQLAALLNSVASKKG